ncbi:hypothetical protein E8E15_007852 [Penicillium rubens]|jgi:hypothetical protein|nr:hypothetical protein E8E15_007852 [Penicillium rubens]
MRDMLTDVHFYALKLIESQLPFLSSALAYQRYRQLKTHRRLIARKRPACHQPPNRRRQRVRQFQTTKQNATESAIRSSTEGAEPPPSGSNMPQAIRRSQERYSNITGGNEAIAILNPTRFLPSKPAISHRSELNRNTSSRQPRATNRNRACGRHGRGPGTC